MLIEETIEKIKKNEEIPKDAYNRINQMTEFCKIESKLNDAEDPPELRAKTMIALLQLKAHPKLKSAQIIVNCREHLKDLSEEVKASMVADARTMIKTGSEMLKTASGENYLRALDKVVTGYAILIVREEYDDYGKIVDFPADILKLLQ